MEFLIVNPQSAFYNPQLKGRRPGTIFVFAPLYIYLIV